MSRRTLTVLSITCTTALFPAAACTPAHTAARHPAPSTSTARSNSADATTTPRSTPPPAQQPPELDPDETLAGRQKATTGNAGIEFSKGRKGDALIVAVRCRGKGTMNVAVQSVHVSFTQKCLATETSTTYNQVKVAGVDHSGVVSVEAPSAVRWSLTVGRGRPGQEEPPGIS
ncbi:hypothetical protein LXH13_21450 [Streptomyces spinosirectus]|uniref:hypothetical protein n=1 Tax=Streptomyces TaxID=1883 RepID=UPI000FFE6D21|nr:MULTISPECIES: hypothetical protein [Streptomyces]MBY8345088.1 hypothetical protein [Streptomyces plumbidurans]UIR19454.1 hypothetical protein LXH13_21450 [Streptomyces spinosirectus]